MIVLQLLRWLPNWLQEKLFFRFFYPVKEEWYSLFAAASLKYAPGIRMDLLPTDLMHAQIALFGVYEKSLSKHLADIARKGGVMIDIGANAGYFSLIWAAANPTNRVVAFEPSPRNVEILGKNKHSNGFDEQIRVFAYALGRSNDVLDFDLGPNEQTGWGGLALSSSANSIKIPVKRLDEIIDKDSKIDFMKIDVEGADTWVLMGAENLLRNKSVNEIYYEQSKPRLRQLGIRDDDASDFLCSVGYLTVPLTNPSADVVVWRAVPK